MKLYPLSMAFVCLLVFLLTLFVYTRNKKSPVNKAYLFFGLSLCVWLLGDAMQFFLSTQNTFWIKFMYSGVILIPIFVYKCMIEFLNLERDKKIYPFVLFIGICFFIANLTTNLFVREVYTYPWGYYLKATFLVSLCNVLYVASFIRCTLASFLSFYNKKDKLSPTQYNKNKYVFFAIAIGMIAGFDYMPAYGIGIRPFGYIFATVFIAIIAYAIVKHQLMDIEVIIRRTVVFAGLFAAVYGVIAFFSFLTQDVFQAFTGGNRWIALIPSIFIITLTLRPLEIFLVRTTDKYLFQKKYDYKELLKTFSNDVLSVMDLKKILIETINSLINTMRVENCGILTLDRNKNVFELASSKGIKNKNIVLERNSSLISYLERAQMHIVNDKQIQQMDDRGTLKEDMKKLGADLVLPLILHNSLIGALTLGSKKSGEPYTQDDLDILIPLSRSEAVAISNAQVMDDLSKTQAEAAQREKMAVIGTLAAGINHEICNPLGIARGQCEVFLLNSREGLYSSRAKEEQIYEAMKIMEKVIKETDRATAITKKLSSFAKPGTGDINEDVSIAHEIDEVMTLVGHELELEKIQVIKDIPGNLSHIRADRKQIQEIFFNIIRNAGQAMEKEGKITVRARKVDSKIVIDIEDTGHGIPEDRLEQIFNPFYTTKAPGKGTGLGLFIVRQVINRNNGTISVKSKVGEGTRFTLTFPIPQLISK